MSLLLAVFAPFIAWTALVSRFPHTGMETGNEASRYPKKVLQETPNLLCVFPTRRR
jgi:hypothetical protein